MCRSCAEGGRRCNASTDAKYRSDYRKRLRASRSADGVSTDSYDVMTATEAAAYQPSSIAALADQVHSAYSGDAAVIDALTSKYGSPEEAVTHTGNVIRQEAERRSGVDLVAEQEYARTEGARISAEAADIVAEQKRMEQRRVGVFNALADMPKDDRDSQRAEFKQEWDAFYRRDRDRAAEVHAADAKLRAHVNQAKKKLADSYREVLAESRSMGGVEPEWNARTSKAAVAEFNAAAAVYPTAWLEKSNQLAAPVAKITKRRAHYDRGAEHATRKREHAAFSREYVVSDDIDSWCRNHTDEGVEYRVLGRGAASTENAVLANDEHVVQGFRYVTQRVWSWDEDQPGGPRPPSGRGWELYDRGDGTARYWRRPEMRMREVAVQAAPEIRTNDRGVHAEGTSPLYATCTHELAHRMEHAVPEVLAMERDFLQRRTTGPNGAREEMKAIYKQKRGHAPEVGYDDNFPLHYSGKVYQDRTGNDGGHHYELLSTGVEALFGGQHGGYVGLSSAGVSYSRDDDYRSFVLGVLACAERTK